MTVPETSAPVEAIVVSFRSKGVELWAEGGQLRYRAPPGTLTAEDKLLVHTHRAALMAYLQTARPPVLTAPLLTRGTADESPLSFSQLSHWRLFRLGERPSIRSVAYAARWQGRMDVGALRESVAWVVARHQALRTRIVIRNEVPVQRVRPAAELLFAVDELAEWELKTAEQHVQQSIAQLIREPVHLGDDPLLAVRLLRLPDQQWALTIAMDHIVSDAVSLSIFTRELYTAYAALVRGRNPSLPQQPVQLADFAHWQHAVARTWIAQQADYCNQRISAHWACRYPLSAANEQRTTGFGFVPLCIAADDKRQLQLWSRSHGTLLPMTFLAVFAAVLARQCCSERLVIRCRTSGRTMPSIEQAIGYFASVLYLPLTSAPYDTLADSTQRVTEAYCEAYRHADHSYLEASVEAPAFTRAPVFNWVSEHPMMALDAIEPPITDVAVRPFRFPNPAQSYFDWDSDPEIVLYDLPDTISGGIYFPLKHFSRSAMEHLAQQFMRTVSALAHDSRVPFAHLAGCC